MSPNVLDPWHFSVWMTGAAVWTAVMLVALSVACWIAWRALYATAEVGRQLFVHHVVRRRTRAERHCTPAEAWRYAFCTGWDGSMRRWR